MRRFLTGLVLLAPVVAQADTRWIKTVTDTRRCKREEHRDEGDYNRWRCPDAAGLQVLIEGDDDRYDLVFRRRGRTVRLDYGTQTGEGGFRSVGGQAEWLLREGMPVAVVYRVTVAKGGDKGVEQWVVARVGRKQPCIVAVYPAAKRDLSFADAEEEDLEDRRCLSPARVP
jgi:hypothetical protein